MTDYPEKKTADGMDPTVSAQYRRLADESAPGQLNRAVLRAARKQTRNNSTAIWQQAWLRPAGYVAMVALSLAIILEMNEANILAPPFLTGDQLLPAENTSNAFQEAADAATQQVREAEATAAESTQNPGIVTESPAAAVQDSGSATPQRGDQSCSDDQRASIATWWRCIESLESRGATDAAERELTALVNAFPGFVAPNQQRAQ